MCHPDRSAAKWRDLLSPATSFRHHSSEAKDSGEGRAKPSRATLTDMSKREEWRKVLDSEVQRWSAMSCDQLIFELHNLQVYVVELESKKYQVEVILLENTDKYLHIMVAVDDGSLPASISPLTSTFISQKPLI
jgi:hypothetical protein